MRGGTDESPSWLADAVLYQIYPQSFADSNADGIGDFAGARARLDHLQWLGIDTIWLNPCFTSPHRDAGYDVANYLEVDPRYGTNEDLELFVAEAATRGIRVLLDLVAGHTSDEHPWFRAELAGANTGRYIWREDAADAEEVGVLGTSAWVPSPGPRPGYYLKNFFDSQPALNFGFANPHPEQPWRMRPDEAGPRSNVEGLKEVMAFWLDRGVAGFRVDMAFSLIKDDPDQVATMALWRELCGWLQQHYPQAVLIPEGIEPGDDHPAFHGDFFLVIGPEHQALFNNGGAGRLPWHDGEPCFFDESAQGDFSGFLTAWTEQRRKRPGHPVLLASADHDFSRMVCGSRDAAQAAGAMVFLFTWGCVPSLYYGDEIGMRYLPGLPPVEGSECFPGFYNRAGARTPMQWSDTPNAGFSTGTADELYLPIDPSRDRPHVTSQREDPNSLLHLVKKLVHLRRRMIGSPDPQVLNSGYPLVFSRDRYLVIINPGGHEVTFDDESVLPWRDAQWLVNDGIRWTTSAVHISAFGYAVAELDERPPSTRIQST